MSESLINNEHEEGFDLKTTLKHLERLSAYRSYMMSPCEEEAVRSAIKVIRQLLDSDRPKRVYDTITELADFIPDYGENEEEYNKHFDAILKEII